MRSEMLEFKDTLNMLMQKKNISKKRLADMTGIDRSAITKFTTGERNPSGLDMVNNIAKQLRLDEKEKSQLRDSYFLSTLGKTGYDSVKQINKMFGKIFDKPRKNESFFQPSIQFDITKKVLSGFNEITQAILSICSEDINTKNDKTEGSERKIRIYTSNYRTLSEQVLSMICGFDSEAYIEHIFILDDNQKLTEEGHLYNLDCMINILPLIMRYGNYHPLNFFVHLDALEGLESWFSEMVITENAACIFDQNMNNGFLIRDPEEIEVFSHLYKELENKSENFFSHLTPKDFFGIISMIEQEDTLGSERNTPPWYP
jgi:transcriptional regulator with XRE-family HTH domain